MVLLRGTIPSMEKQNLQKKKLSPMKKLFPFPLTLVFTIRTLYNVIYLEMIGGLSRGIRPKNKNILSSI